MKNTFFSLFLLTTLFAVAFAEETKNIKEHIIVKDRHFIVCDDDTIWHLIPIKARNRSIGEWLWSSPVHSVEQNFDIDLNNFPLPKQIIIQEKPINISEIESHVDSESLNNIKDCSHLVNLYDSNINKCVFAKAYDLFTFVQYLNNLSQEDYDEGYNQGYLIGYGLGYSLGYNLGKLNK